MSEPPAHLARRGVLGVVVGLALLSAACGSTVQQQGGHVSLRRLQRRIYAPS